MFRDQLILHLKAGDGGQGAVSFLRLKFIAKGGPDGGDGGRGGDVVFVATPHMNTLYHLSHSHHLHAENGEPGGAKNCYGKYGQDLVVEVPVGTLVKDRDTGIVLKDMVIPGQRVVLCKGGKGGRGNKSFAGPTNQVPKQYEEGVPGEERWVELELKLIADVGLVGLPNAGKSTLLSRVSDARPKIADYPFTTLVPQPGIVSGPGYRTFVMADLPGLIEGAHTGVGLGMQFLKHVERTRLLLHLVDLAPMSGPGPAEAYKVIRKELEEYSTELAAKPEIVVGNKADLPGSADGFKALKKACGGNVLKISAVTGEGLPLLVQKLFAGLADLGQKPATTIDMPQNVKPTALADRPREADVESLVPERRQEPAPPKPQRGEGEEPKRRLGELPRKSPAAARVRKSQGARGIADRLKVAPGSSRQSAGKPAKKPTKARRQGRRFTKPTKKR